MKIDMMDVGSIRAIDHAFAPHDDSRFRTYLRDKFEEVTNRLGRAGGDVVNRFMERTTQIFEKINNSDSLRKMRAMSRIFRGNRRGNIIHNVRDLEDCRSAGYAMQRWIMASPGLRKDYLRQRVDGYSDSYTNLHGNSVGRDHYDFRRVNNGILQSEVLEDDEVNYFIEHYYEELLEGDRHLESDEQFVILDAQAIAERLREAGYDPTDQYASASQRTEE